MNTANRRFVRLLIVTLLAWLAPTAVADSPLGAVQDSHQSQPAHPGEGAVPEAHGEAGHAVHGEILPPLEQGLAPAITAIVVFLVVLGVLGKFVWPKISQGLKEREEKILSEIRQAELAQQQAKASLEQYERSLAEARAEARRILEETKAQEQRMKADLRAQADLEVARLKEQARQDIESAKRAALAEVAREASSLATLMAGKILAREIRPDDDERLLRESISELQAQST